MRDRYFCSACGARGVNRRTCPGNIEAHEALVRPKREMLPKIPTLGVFVHTEGQATLDVGLPAPEPAQVEDDAEPVPMTEAEQVVHLLNAMRALLDAVEERVGRA